MHAGIAVVQMGRTVAAAATAVDEPSPGQILPGSVPTFVGLWHNLDDQSVVTGGMLEDIRPEQFVHLRGHTGTCCKTKMIEIYLEFTYLNNTRNHLEI